MSRHPEVLWAQRSEKIYLTIALPDAKNVSVKFEPPGLFSFSATGAHEESFDFSLELYGKIIPERSKTNKGLRNILCVIQKEQRGWWKRLVKSDEKPAPYIKVDWNKWCDEDEEEEESDSEELAFDNTNDVSKNGEDVESSDDEGMLCYFLNPRFHYQEGFEFSDNIRSGVTKVIERLAPNVTFAIEATREIAQFRGKIGRFGDLTAQTAVGIMNPDLPDLEKARRN